MEIHFNLTPKVGGVLGGVLTVLLIPMILIEVLVLRGDLVVREYVSVTLDPLPYELSAPRPGTTYLVELKSNDRLQFALDAESEDGTSLFEWRESKRREGKRYVSFSPGVEGDFTLTVSRTDSVVLGAAWIKVYEDDRRLAPKLHFNW